VSGSTGAGEGFLVLDVAFEGQSLNYDQSIGGNVQQLKKIHMNGRVYTMVSRYALRYSLLETGQRLFGWKLADREALKSIGSGNKKVIQPDPEKLCEVLEYVDLDLFGFLATGEAKSKNRKRAGKSEGEEGSGGEGGGGITIARPAPVKISHAISMEPYKFDSHFNVNLGLARRAGTLGEIQNPFQVEEHRSYYKYSVVVSLGDVGVHESFLGDARPEYLERCTRPAWDGNYVYRVERDGGDERKRVLQLVAAVLSLVRSIKGRAEDLSPKVMIAAHYPRIYRSYLDRITVRSESSRETRIEEAEEGGRRTIRIVESQWESPRISVELDGRLPERSLIYAPAGARVDVTPQVAVEGDPAGALRRIGGWIGCGEECTESVIGALQQRRAGGPDELGARAAPPHARGAVQESVHVLLRADVPAAAKVNRDRDAAEPAGRVRPGGALAGLDKGARGGGRVQLRQDGEGQGAADRGRAAERTGGEEGQEGAAPPPDLPEGAHVPAGAPRPRAPDTREGR
jgi:CRISPR-associated protein Cst2